MTTDLPAKANPKAREALEEVARCVRVGFTGNLIFSFKDGYPTGVQRTEIRRFGHIRLGRPLDNGGTPP